MSNRVRVLACWLLALGLGACDSAPEPTAAQDVAEACGDETQLISWIQTALPQSPHVGQGVSVEGVVTLVSTRGMGGFFLEARAHQRDSEPLYSNAIFVRLAPGLAASSPGTVVRVRGHVTELGEAENSLTAIEAERVWVCAEHEDIPPMVRLDDAQLSRGLEALEGMRVRLPGPLTVVGNEALLRTGAVRVSRAGMLRAPTDAHPPGEQAQALANSNDSALFWLDDANADEYPRRLHVVGAALPEALAPWRVGTTVDTVIGVLNQRDGAYRIELIEPMRVLAQASRPDIAPEVKGKLRVAAFNLHNLFNGDGSGGGFPTERGALSADEYARQQAKLAAAVAALAPDVAALMEVENDGDDNNGALAQFVTALNAAVPRGDYRVVGQGKLGSDLIRVALIYRSGRVQLRGEPAYLDSGVFTSANRVPLAQTFVARAGGAPFTVVANHFKSKGSCPLQTDPQYAAQRDQGDGQGCWNALRTQAARELAAWLRTDPTHAQSDRVLIVGDLNAYAEEDPIRVLREAGYVDVLAAHAMPDETRYSFVFAGLAGRLDYALASPSLAPRVRGAAEWHINAAESDVFDYRSSHKQSKRRATWYAPDPYRSSDHDPLLVGLDP
jgi:hypothetical protein